MKEWLRVAHAASGTFATVTLVDDNLSVKWTVKTYVGGVGQGIAEARKAAQAAMADLREAVQ